MENVILIIHLVIAVFLIAVVLLQRSEGGALGMGGGGGGGGGDFLTGRGAANALTKATWGLGAAFIATSMVLTILAVRGTQDVSIIDAPTGEGGLEILVPDLLEGPATPSADSPAAPPPSDP